MPRNTITIGHFVANVFDFDKHGATSNPWSKDLKYKEQLCRSIIRLISTPSAPICWTISTATLTCSLRRLGDRWRTLPHIKLRRNTTLMSERFVSFSWCGSRERKYSVASSAPSTRCLCAENSRHPALPLLANSLIKMAGPSRRNSAQSCSNNGTHIKRPW